MKALLFAKIIIIFCPTSCSQMFDRATEKSQALELLRLKDQI